MRRNICSFFAVTGYTGQLKECSEGDLAWVRKSDIPDLYIWEGDKLFLERMQQSDKFFSMMVRYEGDDLADWKFYD